MCLLLLLAPLAAARSGGQPGKTEVGCTCHGEPDQKVTASFTASNLHPDPGEIVYVTMTVAASAAVAGMNVAAADSGLFAGKGTRIMGEDLTHSSPAAIVDNVAQWEFTWSATHDGTYTLNGVTVAANDDVSVTGDAWNYAEPLTVVVGTGIAPDPADSGEPDSGGDDDDPKDSGGEPGGECGCAAGATGPASPGLWAAAGVGAWIWGAGRTSAPRRAPQAR